MTTIPVALFLLIICQCLLIVSAAPPELEPPEIKLLFPRGIIFRIKDISGTTLAAIHYSINEDLPGTQAGSRNHDITSIGGSYNTYWEYRDALTMVNPGDKINYWVYMIIDGVGHHLLDQSWTAPKAACSCHGDVFTGQCYSNTNQCICKPQYSGSNCSRCADGRFDYPYCIKCYCNYYGTAYSHCKVDRRECVCKPEFDGVKCDRCAPGFYNFKHCVPISQTTPPLPSDNPGRTIFQTQSTENTAIENPVETTTEPSSQETLSNQTLYIVIGALAAVLLISIFTVLVILTRRRYGKDTKANGNNAQIIEFDYQHGRSSNSLVRAGYATTVSNNVYMTARSLSDVGIIEYAYQRPLSNTPTETDQICPDDQNQGHVYLELSHSSYINPVSFS